MYTMGPMASKFRWGYFLNKPKSLGFVRYVKTPLAIGWEYMKMAFACQDNLSPLLIKLSLT
jgi:hypothetical protein